MTQLRDEGVASYLFVAGLTSFTKKDLRQHFSSYGSVASIRFIRDRVTGKRRSFGFVHFKHSHSVTAALADGSQHNIVGRLVAVEKARPRLQLQHGVGAGSKLLPNQHTVASGAECIQINACAADNSHLRHKQTHHWHRTPNPALTLSDLLHKAPRLSELLTDDAQKALAATSRGFRRCFIAQVKVITVASEEDFAFAIKLKWPVLMMVILQHDTKSNFYRYGFSRTQSARVLAHIEVSTLCNRKEATIFILRPQDSPTSDAALAEQAAEQMLQQISAKWPQLRQFTLSHVRPHALGLAILAKLTKCDWSLLTDFAFTSSKLGTQGVSCLVQAHCPILRQLNLSENCLDAEAAAVLAQGNWPLLRELQLGFNPSLDGQAMTHLSAAHWPLQRLVMYNLPVTDTMANGLAKLQLSHLTSLFLNKTNLTAKAVSELASADWPVLRYLTLSQNHLDAETVQHLTRMHMPVLKVLDLTHAKINTLGAYWLVQGAWPLLTDLHLSYNRLDANGVQHLVRGAWLQLRYLSLAGNPFGQRGVKALTKGDWPVLSCLNLAVGMLNRDSARVLGLELHKVSELKHAAMPHTAEYLARNVLQNGNSCWPSLNQILVS